MKDNRSPDAQTIALSVISGLCRIGVYRQSPLSNSSNSELEWSRDNPTLIGLGVIFSKEAYRLYGDFKSEAYIVEGTVNQAKSLARVARLAEACSLGQEAIVSARQYHKHTNKTYRLHESLGTYITILRDAGRLDDAFAALAENVSLWRLEYTRDPNVHSTDFAGKLQRQVEALLEDGRLVEACAVQAELVTVLRDEHIRTGSAYETFTLSQAFSRHIGLLKGVGSARDIYEALMGEVAFLRRLDPLNRESNALTLASALCSLGAFLADAGYKDKSRKAYSRASRVLQRAIVVVRKAYRQDPSAEHSQKLALLLGGHAQALCDANQFNEACDVFEEVIDIQQEDCDRDNTSWRFWSLAGSLDVYAKYLACAGRMEKSVDTVKRCRIAMGIVSLSFAGDDLSRCPRADYLSIV